MKRWRRYTADAMRAAAVLEAERQAADEKPVVYDITVATLDTGERYLLLDDVAFMLREEAERAGLHCEWAGGYLRNLERRLRNSFPARIAA